MWLDDELVDSALADIELIVDRVRPLAATVLLVDEAILVVAVCPTTPTVIDGIR